MPEIDPTTRARLRDLEIRQAALERLIESMGRPAGSNEGSIWLPQWFELHAALDAAGTAAAYPLVWDPSAGTLTADTDVEITLADKLEQHWGLEHEWIRAVPIPAASGVTWVVIESGAPWWKGELTEALLAGSGAACDVTVRSNTVAITAHDDEFIASGRSLPSGTTVAVHYRVEARHWVVLQAKCP